MSYTSKKLHSQKSGMGYVKGATLFFLGMSCVLFMARAFDISPTATNAVQYIQRIFLTQNGDSNSPTEITLDGTNGSVSGNTVNANTVSANTICLNNDLPCRTTWPTGGTVSAGGGESIWSTGLGGIAYYNSGNVGIGTNTPRAKLEVYGSGMFADSLTIKTVSDLFLGHTYAGGLDEVLGLFINDGQNLSDIIATKISNPDLRSFAGNHVVVDNNGYVGIGTSTPGAQLDVQNSARVTFNNEADSGIIVYDVVNGTNVLEMGNDSAAKVLFDSANIGYNVGIGTNTPTERFQIGNYTWLGQNVSATSGAGGTFLRMNGVDPQDYSSIIPNDDEREIGGSASRIVSAFIGDPDYSPNIQLNYKWHYGSTNYVENWKLIGGRQNFYLHHGDGTALPDEILAISKIGNMQLTNTNGSGNLYFTNGILSIGPSTSTKQIKMSVDNTGGKISYGSQNNQIYLKNGGNVGIGTNNPATKLDVVGAITANAYYYTSDKRLKTDITAISDPLQKILNLNGYTFTWKDSGKKDMGVIAQEVEQIFPEIVNTNTEGYKSVEYGNLVAPLIEAVKALNAKVDTQAKEIEILKAMIK